jgi:ABC-type branched-subunit amino acid transport system ATPase component
MMQTSSLRPVGGSGLTIRFGGCPLETFFDVPRAICGLIGPNGAGKTTFQLHLRLYDPTPVRSCSTDCRSELRQA